MPNDKREPQSYGSQADWVTGRTGQNVNDQKGAPAGEHRQFYDERRESEDTSAHQGGDVSPRQLADQEQSPRFRSEGPQEPVTGVTAAEGGAKRGGFFKKRDYES